MSHFGQGGDQFNKTDEYGNPIQYTGGNIGGHGHQTHTGGAHGNQRGGEYGTGVVNPGNKGHGQGGILHRSNSSSSSSEDDGQGGRRKKSIKEKIKEKLPGGNKPTTDQGPYAQGHGATTTPGGFGGLGATTTHEQPEKKGFIEKIKDKLPGHHAEAHE